MFGRRLAVTLIKDKKKNHDPSEGPIITEVMTLDEITQIIVNGAAGLATVVVVTASSLAVIRMAEHVVKTVYR